MSDFPEQTAIGGNRGVLSPWGFDTPIGLYARVANQGYATTATTWTANRAVYQPVFVRRPITVTNMAIRVVTTGGNVDVGIYSWENTLLVSSGTTATAAAGVQTFNITDTYLVPGWYKMALSSNSSTPAFRCNVFVAGIARACGYQEQASAFVLPNPGTPTTYATALAPVIIATYRTTI